MYIYIYTRFCSQLILELLSVESIRARQLCTNDSITGRDESLEISRPEIRALCISLSLSLFICTRLPTALLSPPFHFSFFPLFFSFFFPSFISLPPSPLCFALPPSLPLPFFAPSTFIYPPNFFHSALALTHRKGWLEIGGKGDRAKCGWTGRKRRVGGGASRGCQAQGVPVTCFRSLVLPGPLERPLERETLRSCIPGGPFESNREISRIVVIVLLLY